MRVKNSSKISNKRKLNMFLLAATGLVVVVTPISIAASCAPTKTNAIVFNDFDLRQAAQSAKIVMSETFGGTLPVQPATGTNPGYTAVAPTPATISTLDAVRWASVPKIPTRYASTFEKYEYLKGNYATAEVAAAQTTGWVSSLPTSFAETDYLYARLVRRADYKNPLAPDVTEFELQYTPSGVYDLTTTSGLKALQTAKPAATPLPTVTTYDLNTVNGEPNKTWASYISSATAKVYMADGGFYASYELKEPHVANREYLNSVTPKTETTNGTTTTTYVANVPAIGPTNILFRHLTLKVEYLVGEGAAFDTAAKAAASTNWSDTPPTKLAVTPPANATAATWNKTTAQASLPVYHVWARVVPVTGITFTNNVIDLTTTLDLKAKVVALLPDAPKPAPTVTPAA